MLTKFFGKKYKNIKKRSEESPLSLADILKNKKNFKIETTNFYRKRYFYNFKISKLKIFLNKINV
jgi:hypothetical protein